MSSAGSLEYPSFLLSSRAPQIPIALVLPFLLGYPLVSALNELCGPLWCMLWPCCRKVEGTGEFLSLPQPASRPHSDRARSASYPVQRRNHGRGLLGGLSAVCACCRRMCSCSTSWCRSSLSCLLEVNSVAWSLTCIFSVSTRSRNTISSLLLVLCGEAGFPSVSISTIHRNPPGPFSCRPVIERSFSFLRMVACDRPVVSAALAMLTLCVVTVVSHSVLQISQSVSNCLINCVAWVRHCVIKSCFMSAGGEVGRW